MACCKPVICGTSDHPEMEAHSDERHGILMQEIDMCKTPLTNGTPVTLFQFARSGFLIREAAFNVKVQATAAAPVTVGNAATPAAYLTLDANTDTRNRNNTNAYLTAAEDVILTPGADIDSGRLKIMLEVVDLG